MLMLSDSIFLLLEIHTGNDPTEGRSMEWGGDSLIFIVRKIEINYKHPSDKL